MRVFVERVSYSYLNAKGERQDRLQPCPTATPVHPYEQYPEKVLWEMEIETLQDLIAFVAAEGSIILEKSFSGTLGDRNEYTLRIYDDYVE